MVMDHYMTVTKRRPNFSPKEQQVSAILVWIMVPNLPMELFKKDALTRMGNVLGKTIKIDDTTAEVTKGKYAHVCIEMDLNCPLIPTVNICGRIQLVEYEGFYRVCY